MTGTHYARNDRYAIFTPAALPGAEQFSQQVLTLPIHLGLSDSDVDRVIAAVLELA